MGRDFDYEILSVMRWVRRELVADRYGTDRIFIAGDAAHLMSPTGGFGMNTGIGDAVDLGWKLEAAIKGWGGAACSRSYDAERRPVGLRNVAEASRNLRRMLSTRERLPGPEIFAAGRGERRRAQGIRRLVRRDHAARVVRQRRDAGLPLRQFADRLAGRHAGAAGPSRIPTSRPPGPAPARRMSGSTTAARRSTCSAAALCCCASARSARRRAQIEQAAQAARRAADRASSSPSRRCSPPMSAAWCWCGPTATSPGAPTRSPPMPAR